MRLTNIKIDSFKSFANKVDLPIDDGITAIVGPNGSGKSNIVDAIKWVLGEQSAKVLRVDTMSDLIFSGSESRDAQKRAVVSLTFDNQDHYLHSEFNEIEIKRVIYHNGENEYFINNSKVRLKDITELFTDSGAGKESYNIISQGSVDEIIKSRPEDRRPIFEEAAGVLKYKKRKEESLRKLEKTKINLEKVELLIKELEVSLAPLKEQSDKAIQYRTYKEDLENIEISLITKDIESINQEYQKTKEELASLKEEESSFNAQNSEEISNIEKLKLTSLKLDEEISKTNDVILSLTNEISSIETQSEVLKERNKYAPNNDELTKNLVSLKESSLSLNSRLEVLKNDIAVIETSTANKAQDLAKLQADLNNLNKQKENTTVLIESTDRTLKNLANSISILNDNIENNNHLPYSVKNILNNPRLNGIHNTIGNLIDTEATYMTAIDISLGANANVIVVDTEDDATAAINYLKDNKLGRATFFPLNIIEPRSIDNQVLAKISHHPGFIGIAADLVTYDHRYTNIIANQLGNIIVAKNLTSLKELGNLTLHRYRIVTLEGDILHTGGSLTGGSLKTTNNALKDKVTIENLRQEESKTEVLLAKYNKEQEELTKQITTLKQSIEELTINIVSEKEQINSKNIDLANLEKQLTSINNDIKNHESHLENRLDDTLNKLLEDLYSKTAEKDKQNTYLNTLRSKKSDLATEIANLEHQNREKNAAFNRYEQSIKEKEIKLSKMDVKLDNLLLTLNETYALTYEKASTTHTLDLDIETARLKVANLKSSINKLGVVNLGAPEEYNRISTRYDFLSSQKQELDTSIADLKSIITEMDEIMVTKFQETFSAIEKEFTKVFKELFKGGRGYLKLTNEDDLLNTGIDIIAEPPGKKLNSIVSLSGGEKSLTAIALLFAILNIKTVPFCILDEVEAALDEANVDEFGKYLNSKKHNSQFIIITHKKKTMEYVDVLYGITMQEKGVSKLVSVKLEDK